MDERKQNGKLVQVIQNFFAKALQVVLQARLLPESSDASRLNKWFNLHTAAPRDDWSRAELKLWKNSDVASLPPMIIETLLDTSQLTAREVVVLEDGAGNSWTVCKGGLKKHEVVVERWLVEFDRTTVASVPDELPYIYKQAIVLLRVIYADLRLLPAAKMRLLAKPLVLQNRILDGKQPISLKGRIGLLRLIIPHQMLLELHMTQRLFEPVAMLLGLLRVLVAYRNHHKFVVRDNEEVILRFLQHTEPPAEPPADAEKRKSDRADPSERLLLLPCSSYTDDRKPKLVQIRPSIQPFRVGLMGNSPPHALERRISITSNRLGSNASLAALLRNPRGSTSSSNTPNAMFPRLVLLGGHDEELPRFLLLFGPRPSRRFSGNSGQYGTSAELALSGAVLSGLYIDDDISSFVRMIDGKLDLRLSHNLDLKLATPHDLALQLEALLRFQLLKSQHQQLSDSVASIVHDSRKSSVAHSPDFYASLSGHEMPSITLRLENMYHDKKEVSGLATTPSVYAQAKVGHEFAKFDAADHGDETNLSKFDNDDLLFEMTDTR